MPRGYRRVILAAWLILVAATEAQGRGNESAVAAQPGANRPNSQPSPHPSPSGQLQSTVEDGERCRDTAADNGPEICAQWAAANATREANRLSWQSFYLNLTGLIALILTLFATAWAAWSAGIAAKVARDAAADADRMLDISERSTVATVIAAQAAQRSAEIAEETSKAQLRPYVYFVEGTKHGPGQFMRSETLHLSVKNFGQTPAKNVRIRAGRFLCRRPIGAHQPGLELGDSEFPVIAPGDARDYYLPLDMFTTADIAKVASGKWVFLLRFRVDYTLPDGATDCEDMTVVFDDEALNTHSRLVSKEERERTE